MNNLEESKDSHTISPLQPPLNNLKGWRFIQSQIATLLHPNNKQTSLLSAFQPFLNLLLELNTCKALEEKFAKPTIKAFFINAFLPTGMTTILKCKAVDNTMTENVLNSCLHQMILLWFKNPSEQYSGLGEIAVKILNPTQPYYTHLLRNKSSSVSQPNSNGRPSVFDDVFSNPEGKKVSDLILDLISDKERLLSIKFMSNVCHIVCNISDALPGYLEISYMNKIRDAIMDKLFIDTKSFNVSFTEKSMRAALKAFALLLKKSFYSSTQERHRAIDILRLQICKMALDSNDLQNKRLALKLIVDVVESIKDPQAAQIKSLSRQVLNEFLQRISPQFFTDDSLLALFLEHSRGIFLYLFEQNLVNSTWARKIINFLKGPNYPKCQPYGWLFGGPHRSIVEKLFSREHAKPLFEWIISKGFPNGPEDASAPDAEVLGMIFQVSLTRDLFETSVANFIWEILIHSKKISEPSLFNRVGYVYTHLMRRGGQFLTIIHECVSNLEQDNINPRFFRIIGYLKCQGFFKAKQILSLFIKHIRHFKDQNIPIVNEEDYVAQVSERIYCIEGMFNSAGDREKGLITYDILAELWEIFVEYPSVLIERDLMYRTIYETAGTWTGLLIKPDILAKFYREKILCEEGLQYLGSSKEGAACFWGFFITVNEDLNEIWRNKAKYPKSSDFLVKVPPEQLEGFDELWKLIMSFEHEKAKEEAIDFLISIYSSLEDSFEADMVSIRAKYLDRCFGYLRSSEKMSDDGCFRSLKLIEKMMDESEKYGIGELLTHNRLLKSEMIQLQLFLWKECEPSKLKLSVKSNDTVFDLLKEVAKQTKTVWDEITLFRYPYSPHKIPRIQIGRTLNEIEIKRYEYLKVTKKEIPQADLFRGPDCLSLRARKVLVDLFEEYSDNEKLSLDEFLTFVNEFLQARPHRMFVDVCSRVFSEYDFSRRGYLTRDNFLDYCLSVCKTRPDEVWNHLQVLGKRKDLQGTSEITKKQATISNLISYITASRSEDVKLLFSFLDKKDEIAYQAWKLLSRIPTCPNILRDVLTLQRVRGVEDVHQRDWKSLLNLESKYRFLYALNVVEYLICYDKNQVKIPLIEEDIKLKEYQQTWIRDFINYGGLDHLGKIRDVFKPKSDAISRVLCRKVLNFMRTVSNELDSKGDDMGKEDSVLRFKKELCEYEKDYLAMEYNIAANLIRRTILKLKMKRQQYK